MLLTQGLVRQMTVCHPLNGDSFGKRMFIYQMEGVSSVRALQQSAVYLAERSYD